MGQRTQIWILAISLIFLSLGALSAKDKYKDWLKDVDLIILDSEKDRFKKLKTNDDKDFFIKLFWAKRDPTPQTEKNEFKEEYFRRLEYVENSFIYGYNRGTQTDMGKVWLYFGQPVRVFRQDPRVEIWIYPSLPWMNIPKKTFNFVFSRVESSYVDISGARTRTIAPGQDQAGFTLNVQKTDPHVMEAFYAYRKQALLFPNLKELPEYVEVAFFSPESFEGKLIQEVKDSHGSIGKISIEKNIFFTKAHNNSSYMTLLLRINPGGENLDEKVFIFGRLESEAYSFDFRQEKKWVKEKNTLIVQVGFPLLAGEYELFLGINNRDQDTFSVVTDRIKVPDFWTRELSLSSPLASPRVQQTQPSKAKEGFDVFALGQYALTPNFGQEYTKNDSLNVFYYIYNLSMDEDQNCSILIEFELEMGNQRFRLNPQKKQRKVSKEGSLLEGTQISLSALPQPGKFALIIRVTDEIAGTTTSQKLDFTVN